MNRIRSGGREEAKIKKYCSRHCVALHKKLNELGESERDRVKQLSEASV